MKIITRKEAMAQGLKRYFSGKPCKRGHVAERWVSDRKCIECKIQHSRHHRAGNREYYRERSRQWRAENPEYGRQYREENRGRYREHGRRYHAENRDSIAKRARQYQLDNPEYFRASRAKRRAANLQRTLRHDEELTQFVMEEAAQQAKDMEELFGMPFHVDHMMPLQGYAVSGFNVYYNLQVIPASLNISKGNRLMYTKPLEWLADAT